jgi:hypothetical protein
MTSFVRVEGQDIVWEFKEKIAKDSMRMAQTENLPKTSSAHHSKQTEQTGCKGFWKSCDPSNSFPWRTSKDNFLNTILD